MSPTSLKNLVPPLLLASLWLVLASNFEANLLVGADTIPLASILPKVEAIHEDIKSLLIRNVQLKNKILASYQAQNDAKRIDVKEDKPLSAVPNASQSTPGAESTTGETSGGLNNIDFSELEEFNKWVETNLEYAVKNTQATAEALRDEAQQNGGNVDYSEQAVKDGIEGVKYWLSAVIFQDKTLSDEKFEPQLD